MSGAGAGGAGSAGAGSSGAAGQPVFDPGDGVANEQTDELVKQTSHVAKGLGLLIEQFKDKPKIQSLLRGWLQQVQILECVFLDELFLLRWLNAAEGVQLDLIGTIVREPRKGRGDADYHQALTVRILINNSSGQHEEILAIARLLLTLQGGTSPPLVLRDLYPAAIELESTEEPIATTLANVVSLLQLAVGSAIRATFIHAETDNVFQFSTIEGADEVDADTGFSDTGELVGGGFAGASQI